MNCEPFFGFCPGFILGTPNSCPQNQYSNVKISLDQGLVFVFVVDAVFGVVTFGVHSVCASRKMLVTIMMAWLVLH